MAVISIALAAAIAIINNTGQKDMMVTNVTDIMENIPLGMILLLCLTIGLAPFNPPHIWEKLQMLTRGELVKPLDWFDLFFHGVPWLLLIVKLGYLFKDKQGLSG